MADETPTKKCKACCVDLPATEENFHRDAHSADGWRHTCIDCRRLIDKEKERQLTIQTQNENMDLFVSLELKGIDALIRSLGEGSTSIPHAAEVYQHIMHGFGGSQTFAQQLVALYHNPKSSPHIKMKVMQEVLRLSSKISESGMLTRDLEHISNADLERMLKERMHDALNGEYVKARSIEYGGNND